MFPAALSTALLSHRLDVKVQRVDKGYPRATDDVFTGVPLDARNVFLYQGEWTLAAGCCVSRPGLPEPLMALLRFLAWDARVCGEWPQDRACHQPQWVLVVKHKVLVAGHQQGAGCHVPVLLGQPPGWVFGRTPADPPFPPPLSLPRQVSLLPGQLLLEDDTALPGGPSGLRQV